MTKDRVAFNKYGLLPKGDYEYTFGELRASVFVRGPKKPSITEFASGHIERELNKRDPYKIWTWDSSSRRSYRGYMKKQLPMWHKYRVEFYPHYGQDSGITDRHENPELFPAAFRKCRTTNREKGIIKIVK